MQLGRTMGKLWGSDDTVKIQYEHELHILIDNTSAECPFLFVRITPFI